MSDDTDDDVPFGQPSSRRKIIKRILSSDSPSSSSNEDSPILRTKKNARNRVVSDSDSDSSDNFSRYSRKRKKVALITSDSEDDSDGSDLLIIRKSKRVANIVESDTEDQGFKCTSSQWETDESENEENVVKHGNNTQSIPSKNEKDPSDSDSSDSRKMEECTICLLPIDKQEVGNPESCNHLFCLACILEWSKNVNTCPIDRQEYHMIFIKNRFNGNIIGKIPIERPLPPDEPQEDPILCEICGLGDREDRLLLCDGCDLGFHLECIMPGMDEIPAGSWYCNVCAPSNVSNDSIEVGELRAMSPTLGLLTREDFVRIFREPRRRDIRLNPRSSQTERVISRIVNHRSTTQQVTEQLALPSSSSMTTEEPRRHNVKRKKPKKSKRKAYKKKYRMVYEIDELTGEVISKKKQVRVRKGRRNRRNWARTPKPQKTVKKRLAQQLGICPMRLPNQSLPDVRVQNNNNNAGLNNQRFQAGIPTLHLFGQRDEIDYFSASEEEDVGGPDYLVRRRAHQGDVALFRRQARRKGVSLPQIPSAPAPSSTLDLLGSIMNSQSQLFSKDVKLSVDNSGKLKIENTHKNVLNTSNNKPDLNNFDDKTKKTPYGGNNRNNERRSNPQRYSNPPNPYPSSSYYPYDNFASSTSENNRSYSNSQGNRTNRGGGYDQDMPQDYTQSTLSSYDRDVDSENSQRNEQGEDSDIDIYSDIEESVSTTKMEEEGSMKPLNLSPSVVPDAVAPSNNGSDFDNENNDSDDEMVIDTEKVETPTQDEEEEAVKEETAVSSSEDTVVKPNLPPEAAIGLHSTSDNQPEVVESTFNRSREEEEDEDEDGCPNFNIYSTESINLAKNTDISLNPEENNQVVSSTPLPEPPKPPPGLLFDNDDVFGAEEGAYDPEAAYHSEKESETIPEEVYDPERVYDTPEDTVEPERNEEYDCERKEESSNEIFENSEIPLPPSVEDDSSVNKPFETKEKIDDVKEQQSEQSPPVKVRESKAKNANTLYSDSEDEEIVKISQNSFIVGDISTMTEDVSEEERSYTPCLDEKATDRSKGLDDLGTEMISDDEKNDFEESHEHKTASEGDALEINAKESEIDMIRPEDYEEGEIVDKSKAKMNQQEEISNEKEQEKEEPTSKPDTVDSDKNKNNKKVDKKNEQKQESFKKLSKSNKERNYRDKEGGRSGSKSRDNNSKNKEREKRNKRKEIERYDVRALIAEKPRRLKDKFGRDIRKSSSRSRSRSYTPKNSPEKRSPPKRRLSAESRERKRKKRSRSRRRSSESRSKSRQRKRSLSRSRRRRSRSRSKRREKKKSKDSSKRRKRGRSASRTYTPSRKRRKDWEDGYSRERGYSAEARWTPSLSRSPEVEPARHLTPSWTPPRTLESATVDPRGLTVILQNDQNKKKKDKRKKNGKKGREVEKRTKRKKKDQTPQPSKEVFASGDNILVSVSFNKENERRERDVFTKKKKEIDDREKKKRTIRRKKRNQELSTIKPVAIIDLERSPFRELTPSPKDIIVLSDEDHVENNVTDAQDACDSSQQVASPENLPVYMTGPKTPPEPQVKFSIPSKQPTLRPLSINPLHDPEDEIREEQEEEEEEEEEECQEMHEMDDTHIGPNTPPEPPNSPPSSPDAYDPFEPTKSRSPSPDKSKANVDESEKRNSINDLSLEKNTVIPSLTPPIADIQPADSQSSLLVSRDSSKSPDQVGRSNLPSTNKTATVQSFAPATNSLTSTPIPSNTGAPRINILSSTILGNVSSTMPQRVVLPNIKLSPVKISPVKNVVKSTPIKPMPSKPGLNKSKGKQQNGANDSSEVISLDFDSPYSPGSSDYEDLFEPPPEVVTKKTLNKSAPAAVGKDSLGSGKSKGAFDSLFETPMNKMKKMSGGMDKSSKSRKSKGTKIVGVKLDEDHLKILDDLPNSAVEMQVKDKFLKKLNRQERVVEEVKLVLKPYYNKKKIDKEEYKDIMRRAVPKICHNKSGEINPTRIKNLVEAYVKKIRHAKPKVTSSSSYNPLKG